MSEDEMIDLFLLKAYDNLALPMICIEEVLESKNIKLTRNEILKLKSKAKSTGFLSEALIQPNPSKNYIKITDSTFNSGVQMMNTYKSYLNYIKSQNVYFEEREKEREQERDLTKKLRRIENVKWFIGSVVLVIVVQLLNMYDKNEKVKEKDEIIKSLNDSLIIYKNQLAPISSKVLRNEIKENGLK